jgi:cytochrome P450
MAATIQLAERPLHVPVEAVYHFDMFNDPGLLADPHARGLELADQAPPIFWTPCNGGHWMVVGYAEARQVLNDPHTFASSPFTEAKMRAIRP